MTHKIRVIPENLDLKMEVQAMRSRPDEAEGAVEPPSTLRLTDSGILAAVIVVNAPFEYLIKCFSLSSINLCIYK